MDSIQPHLGLHAHTLPLHTFTPSPTPGSSSSTKPHLLRYVNKEIIKDVDLPGLSVEDIEAVLSENEDWSGEQMDQFLRSAIDLSDIEAKVLSGGYESDSGYSTYDVSPITSTAPTQLTFATSSQLPGLQAAHGHHVDQSLFSCNLSPTATMFPGGPLGHAQPPTSLLHDAIHSPCSSDVGFFSPHSGFSSHATTPSHQDALSFFPSHGGPCPIFTSYSQPQDFNSLNMSTCFPDGSIPNSDSTIPPFSSQIPDILLPDASLAPPTHPHPPMSMPNPTTTSIATTKFPKSEPVHTACKVQVPPPPVAKPVAMDTSSVPKQNAESAAEIKIESHPNSCVFAAQTQTESSSLPELTVSLKKEDGVEQETQTTASKQEAPTKSSKSSNSSSQALLSKLLGQNGPPAATIVSITAINNNGTKTKLDLSQLHALVGQTNSNIKGGTKIVAKVSTSQKQSGSASDSEVTSNSIQASPSTKSKSSTPGPKSVPMKATQRKKGQWPRSMSKANLMAFREHILNKLKKGQENSNSSGNCEGGQKESSSNGASSMELMKCETPSPSSGCGEVEVTYERNRSAESRCHSEPAEMFGGPTSSPNATPLQSSHSESYLHDCTAQQQHGFGSNDADTKLADFFPQNCNDVFNLFQFNPDALLSTTIDDQMLDGIDLVWGDEDSCKVDNEIAQFLDSEINGTTSETPMELGVQYDIMGDHSPITNSPHTSPLVSPANYNSRPSSPQKSMTPSYGYTTVPPTDVSRTYHSERALVTGHVTSGPMGAMQMGMFNFPDMLVTTDGTNEMDGASIENEMKLHIQQNLLQAHHDPLLTGSSTLLQACGPEAFEF